MCLIPGLPAQGSVVSVLVTRVNLKDGCGLVELWVNIDDGRTNIYQQMREDIQHPERKFNGVEGRPGNFCLVCISDIWHRAQIASIERENYKVFLIDQAQSHVTTGRSLAWAKSDSFVLPPEIESCILANVLIKEKELERAETFLKSLPGKAFEALVQDLLTKDRIIVLNVPAVSQEMCDAGLAKKIPEDEFGNLVQKSQENRIKSSRQLQKHSQYFYPALATNTYEYVYVAQVIDPQNIFCRLLIFSSALKLLSEEIQQHYEEKSEFAEAQPRASGDPCAAKGSDGRWNRSVLKQNMAAAGLAEVMHVDEGTTELVSVDDVKPLHEKFLRMPVVTYPCHLDGVKESGTGWTKDQMDYLKSLILNQTALAMFSHHIASEGIYRVTLYASDAACVNSCFIERCSSGADPNASDEPILPFLQSNKQVSMKVQKTSTNTKTLAANDRKEAAGSDDLDDSCIKNGSDSLLHHKNHSAVFLSDEAATSDGTFPVGSNVSVKVTCIESLHKFWCQKTEKSSSLRRLMQNLQSHYAFAHPQPIVESICVARNPDDGMWYRARIMASQHSPVVDVRFIDFGHVQKVPLREVRPIDPAFLRLNAQAFQCCLFGERSPCNPTAFNWAESALADFQKFEDRGASPDAWVRCVVKAVTLDEEGLPLNVIEFEAPSEGDGKLVALKGGNHVQNTPCNGYSYSPCTIEVGGKEKVVVTSCNNVNHFYCILENSSRLFSKLHEDIQQFVEQDLCRQRSVGPDSICIAKHPDNHWYRGQVVENSPQIKVHFVDHGDTLVVNECDICAFPDEAAFAKSAPVLAILLGLFAVPEEVPQEVNLWFAQRAVNHMFTISVVAKGGNGKLIVELIDGSVNVNAVVREVIKRMRRQTTTTPDQQQPNGSRPASKSDQTVLPQESRKVSSNGECVGDGSESEISGIFVQEDEMNFEAKYKQSVDVILGERRSLLEPAVKQTSFQACSESNVDICTYKRPDVPPEQTREVFASCIVGPLYFWCQYAATEELETISTLAQEVGQSQGDLSYSLSLNPGSQCLALFSDDNQWYRAQVLHRHDNKLHLVFIDYGNEADVEVKHTRPLPLALLERAPQAFLCSLDGFEESQGSWDDTVYDVFFNLLVDKLLRVTVFNVQDNQEMAFPQYSVQIQFEKTNVNDAVKKYWTPAVKKHVAQEDSVTENVPQYGETASMGNEITHTSENGNSSENKQEVFATCIVDPFFFWCQYSNTGDLNEISRLSQEAGQSQLDTNFPKTLVPGSLCLALFSSDNQWYRAQVMDRRDDSFHVVFIDYGKEADVDVKNVRSLPVGLLDMAPQAFLCSLGGFDESRGSWDDGVYFDFYNFLANKPLKLSVLEIRRHSETALPQHQVEIECEGEDIKETIKKYWKPLSKQSIPEESRDTDMLTQGGQTDFSQTHAGDSKEKTNAVRYKQPTFSRDKRENVYASCIVGPSFFWCQYADTENLVQISQLCQEAGQTQPNASNETAAPEGPCLALFSSDSRWYRAQVMARRDTTVHVVFVDYGNEADVAVECVRELPPGLLATAPQAFLCCLNGFDESDSSWHDDVCEDFYSLLVDKPLRVKVLSTKASPEIEVLQYMVQVEFKDVMIGGWLDVNTLMDRRARQKVCLATKVQLG